jgi:hypothetical protein
MDSFTGVKKLADKMFNRSPRTQEAIELKEMKLEDHKCMQKNEIISLSIDDFLSDKKKQHFLDSFPV